MAIPTETSEWADWSLKFFGPPFTMLALFVLGLIRGWWYLDREVTQLRAERDEWKSAAKALQATSGRAINVVEKATEGVR